MGHIRLGRLSATRNWRQVVALLEGDADVPQIAQATAEAAERGLRLARQDPSLVHTFWLLSQIPLAAREERFVDALRSVGVRTSDEPSLFDVVHGFADAIDQRARERGQQTDIGEMARLAGTEALTALCRQETPGLFTSAADDLRNALRSLSTRGRFNSLAEEFFGRFTQRFLAYHLSRELSNHVGPDRRFRSVEEHDRFNGALDLHCRQTARIVREFAGGWYSKTLHEEHGIPRRKAEGFVAVALKKIRDELGHKGTAG